MTSLHLRAVVVAASVVIGVLVLTVFVSAFTFGLLHVTRPSHVEILRNT